MIRFDLVVKRGSFTARAALDTESRVTGLFGPTGSGKTTLLLALAGLVKPQRGRIEVGGTLLYDSSRNLCLPPERRRVGMVFQDGRLFPHLSVRENLRYPHPAPAVPGPAFDEIVHLLDLEPLLDRRPRALSGGQRRLVAVGRALLSRPRLLLLDEPLTGMDSRLRRRVLAYLLRLKRSLDVNMMLVSHVYSDFLALVEEMGILDRGRIQAVGTPEALMETALGTTGAGGVETTLRGKVAARDGEWVAVECEANRFHLFLPGAPVGAEVYVTIRAEDVLLAVGEPPRTSARNLFSGTVARVHRVGSRVLVGVDVGCLLWSELAERSAEELGITPGRRVHLLIKASALRGALPGEAAVSPAASMR